MGPAGEGSTSVLDPAVVAAVDDLEVAARLVVEGMRAGEHRSPFHGFNHEFSQHRAYRPGDDLKYVDWKALARTDRLYTRQFRETTNMSLMFVVDTSASMGFPADGVSVGTRRGGSTSLAKLRFAAIIAAAMSHLVVTGGDRVGLMTMTGDDLAYLPARGSRSHLRLLLQRLSKLEPVGRWQPGRAIRRAAELLRRRGMMIVLSDFYDDEDDTLVELRRAAARGHEVAMLHVMSREELELPYRGTLEFEDLEGGARRLTDAAGVRGAYQTSIEAFCNGLSERALKGGIDYTRMVTDEAPSRVLREYLVRREAAAGHRHTHPHRKP